MPIKNSFAERHAEITGWRRDFHAHPEILYETHRTSARVAELLRSFGCDDVVEGLGRTGVVGVIRGKQDRSGKVVGLRADMDALPLTEQTGLDYASTTPGAMHACGHDGHTAMLLGAAQYLCETRNFDGTCVVIFQPAEEGGGGGREMCEDGLMERFGIQEVYGMHNWPWLSAASFAVRAGPVMAVSVPVPECSHKEDEMSKTSWYKGCLHAHSTESDGDESPKKVARWFQDYGYDWLVLSDHNVLTVFDTERPLMISGEEVTVTLEGEEKAVYVNGVGISRVVEPVNAGDVLATVQASVNGVLEAFLPQYGLFALHKHVVIQRYFSPRPWKAPSEQCSPHSDRSGLTVRLRSEAS